MKTNLKPGEAHAVVWARNALRRLVTACDGGANGWWGHGSCKNGKEEREAVDDAESALSYLEQVFGLGDLA